MIRLAAAGDLHYDRGSTGRLKNHLDHLADRADLLLLAGDLTQTGHYEEAAALARDLEHSPVPVISVLGNHDYHMNHEERIRELLVGAGVTLLERQIVQVNVRSMTVGVVGLKGFGGGFIGACACDFGEREMKAFVRHTKSESAFLSDALSSLKTDYRIALLHYAPTDETLLGERREIYPFLGSYLLGEAADEGQADIVFHGHAHAGVEKGKTPGGIPVRNVAQHVIRHVFNIYSLDKEGCLEHVPWNVGAAPHTTQKEFLP